MPYLENKFILLQCPHCTMPLQTEGNSLVCQNKHRFDIAKQGYVNLAPQAKQSFYDKDNFAARNHILEQGYYKHVLQAVQNVLTQHAVQSVVDVGCGEGYYCRNSGVNTRYACDIAKPSIQMAAKKDPYGNYLVADLAKLPFTDHSFDALLNIYSPANYKEFLRVLKKGGLLCKVVHGTSHIQELRALAAPFLQNKNAQENSAEYFAKQFPAHKRFSVHESFAITQEDLHLFCQMTPLFFHVPWQELPLEKVHTLTIAAEILLAKIE